MDRKLRHLRAVEASYRHWIKRAQEEFRDETVNKDRAHKRYDKIKVKYTRKIDKLQPKIRDLAVRRSELKAEGGSSSIARGVLARMGGAPKDLAARVRRCTRCPLPAGRGHAGPGGGPPADVAAARRRSFRFEGIPVIATYPPAATLYNRRLTKVVEDDITRAAKLARIPRLKRSGKPRPGKPVRTALSSGCAVIDPEGGILLIRRADERIWGCPKGTVA